MSCNIVQWSLHWCLMYSIYIFYCHFEWHIIFIIIKRILSCFLVNYRCYRKLFLIFLSWSLISGLAEISFFSSFIQVLLKSKNCIHLRCTVWCLDVLKPCAMMTTIRLIFIYHVTYLTSFVRVVNTLKIHSLSPFQVCINYSSNAVH